MIDIINLSLNEMRLKTFYIPYFKTAQQVNKTFLLGFNLIRCLFLSLISRIGFGFGYLNVGNSIAIDGVFITIDFTRINVNVPFYNEGR